MRQRPICKKYNVDCETKNKVNYNTLCQFNIVFKQNYPGQDTTDKLTDGLISFMKLEM